MSLWKSLRGWLGETEYVLQGFVLYLSMTTADFISSLGIQNEANGFARHASGAFWPWHAFINVSVNTFGIALLSASLFAIGRSIGKQWASFVAAVPWILFGWEHLDAAMSNFQVRAGLYQETVQDVLEKIFGR